jgi:predicted nucleotidyltransferase
MSDIIVKGAREHNLQNVDLVERQSNLCYNKAMLTREDILTILRDNKERFAEKYGVTKLGLFGSFARNEATEESDVDVCVEMTEVTYDIMFDLREEIVEKTSRPVDLIRLRRGLNGYLRKRIKKEAIYV